MKKLFLILLILCLGSTAYAFNPFVVFSGVPAVSGSCVGGSDGLIGYDTYGPGMMQDNSNNNMLFYHYYTPTEDGTVTYAHSRIQYTGNYNVGIWDGEGATKGDLLTSTGEIAISNGVGVSTYQHDSVDSYCLIAGHTYIIGARVSVAYMGVGAGLYDQNNFCYAQSMATFGDFTPSDTPKTEADITITFNNSGDSF